MPFDFVLHIDIDWNKNPIALSLSPSYTHLISSSHLLFGIL